MKALSASEHEAKERSSSGFTWRVVLAIIYGAIVLQPVAIWLGWAVGVDPFTIAMACEFTVLFLFSFLADYFGKPLSKQEAFILYSNVGTTVIETVAATLVFNFYVRNSPAARAFEIGGVPIGELIPWWYAPPLDPSTRSLFLWEWLPVIAVWIFVFGILLKMIDLSLGYFSYRLYVVEEKLPFPGAKVWAEACITMSEELKNPEKMRILIFSALAAIFWNLITYGLWLTTGVSVVPVWNDLTGMVESVLPGASIGFVADLVLFYTGFIIPWHVCISIAIGGIATYVIGNYLAVQLGLFPSWKPGSDANTIFVRSQLDFWISPMIGISMAAGIAPLIRRPSLFARALASSSSVRSSTSTSMWTDSRFLLGVFLLGGFAASAFAYYLCLLVEPTPLMMFFVIALITVGWTFLSTLITARAIGEAAVAPIIPYVQQGVYYAVNYQGVAAWFTPVVSGNVFSSASGWPAVFFACDLTNTSKWDYLKAYFVAFPLTFLMSFVYVQAFWSIAPIPSSVYPYIAAFWPIQATYTLMWPARPQELLKMDVLVGSLVVGLAIALAADFLHIPFSLIGFATGMGRPIPITMTILAGGIFGKLMERKMGKEWWKNNLAVVAAGLGLGEGLVIAIASALALIGKSLWMLPF